MSRTGFTREGILQVISDVHKSAYGFRPHGTDYASMTDEALFTEFEQLCAINDAEIAREREMLTAAYKTWQADIANIAATQNISKARAILWDMVAYRADYGVDQYCYERNIDYTVQSEINAIFMDEGLNEAEVVRYVRQQLAVAA